MGGVEKIMDKNSKNNVDITQDIKDYLNQKKQKTTYKAIDEACSEGTIFKPLEELLEMEEM